MRINERCYPHPVLGHASDGEEDVSGSMFQASIDVGFDQTAIFFDVHMLVSNPTIQRLLSEKKAEYVVHVECGQTFYRRAERSPEGSWSFVVSKDMVNGGVEVLPVICARERIQNYQVEGAHKDFEGVPFTIEEGDFLAIGDPFEVDVDVTFDVLQKVSSIMELQLGVQPDGDPMEVDFTGDKIIVSVSRMDFANFKLCENNVAMQEVAVCMLSLPVLIEAVQKVLATDDEGLGELRWYKVLRAKVDDLGVGTDDESLEIAQRILESPLRRAFAMLAEQLENLE